MLSVGIIAAVCAIILVAGTLAYRRLSHRQTGDQQSVLVAAGREFKDDAGNPTPFRIIREDTYIRYPVIESVHEFSLEPLELDWQTTAVPAELDHTLQFRGAATVRPARDDDGLRTAIKNFIGLDRSEITRAASVSIESTVQQDVQDIPDVRARNTDDEWVDNTARRAADELTSFGLILENFQISEVRDDPA